MTIARIERGRDRPRFIQNEAQRRRKYPCILPLEGGSLVLRYRISSPVDVGEVGDAIHRRDIFGWVSAGRKRVAGFELHEFDIAGCSNNHDFLEAMDIDCGAEAEMARVLSVMWADIVSDIGLQGPILEFRGAWISREYAGKKLMSVANELIEKCCPDHSILVMKAFPLEYEGSVPDGAPERFALEQRQVAMNRLYGRIFGVEPFPDGPGKEFWLWRKNKELRDFIPDPTATAPGWVQE